MPTIPNFPQSLLDQHHHWHVPSAHPGTPGGRTHPQGSAGGGEEFLTFHRNYVSQFKAWYVSTTFTQSPFDDPVQKAALVDPWSAIPNELKTSDLGWTSTWADDENRLTTFSPDFSSADDLGTFIETGVHNNFLHGAAATFYGEPILGGFHSPTSTLFYKLHGLVDHWWSMWQFDHKVLFKEIAKEIFFEVALKDFMEEVKNRGDEVKAASFEVPDFLHRFDPVILETLSARISRVEETLFPLSATFIRGHERPVLRDHVTEERGKEHDHG